LDSFATLTEFSVAIAGFSGIAIAIGARGRSISSLTQFRNRNLLTFSIGAAFGSVLPPLARTALSPAERKATSWLIWIVSIVGTSLAGIAQLLNIVGVFGAPGPGPLYAAIVWTILMATIQFYRVLTTVSAETGD
jgi:hypothetical protein